MVEEGRARVLPCRDGSFWSSWGNYHTAKTDCGQVRAQSQMEAAGAVAGGGARLAPRTPEAVWQGRVVPTGRKRSSDSRPARSVR